MSFPWNITNPGFDLSGLLTSQEAQFVSDLTGITYAAGDILYYDGAQLNTLGAGTDGHVLTLASGIPSWAAGGSIAFNDLSDVTVSSTDPETADGTFWVDIS